MGRPLPVGGYLARARAVLEGAREEPAGGCQIPLFRDQHVDDLPVLVDGPVQIDPAPGDLDVGFVDEPPITWDVPALCRRRLRGLAESKVLTPRQQGADRSHHGSGEKPTGSIRARGVRWLSDPHNDVSCASVGQCAVPSFSPWRCRPGGGSGLVGRCSSRRGCRSDRPR